MLKLVILSPGLTGRSLEVGSEWITIGRSDDSPFQIQEASISSQHCQVRERGSELLVRDLNSTNGTYIMGTRIRENTLKVGQKLRLGSVELRLEACTPKPAAAPAPAKVKAATPSGSGRKRVPLPPAPVPVPVSVSTPARASVPQPAADPAAKRVKREAVIVSRPSSPPRAVPTAPPQKYQVLLVDDNKPFLETVTQLFRVLANNTWDIHCTSAPDQALQMLQRKPFDLVILDVTMPMLDGVQLLGLIHRRHPDVKKAVVTGHANEKNRNTCLTKGADLFMEKPLSGDGLKAVFYVLNELVSCPSQGEGFCGTLRNMALQDILQMECLRANSSVLEIRTRAVCGEVYIENGVIIHASAGMLTGEPALFQLLSLSNGEFHSHPFKSPEHRTVRGQWEALLMEAARVRDETALISRSSVAAPADEAISVTSNPTAELTSTVTASQSAPATSSSNPSGSEDEFIVVATYDGEWNPANGKKANGDEP